MVRLKVGDAQREWLQDLAFQFQNGAIKRRFTRTKIALNLMFQFQNGAIKSKAARMP